MNKILKLDQKHNNQIKNIKMVNLQLPLNNFFLSRQSFKKDVSLLYSSSDRECSDLYPSAKRANFLIFAVLSNLLQGSFALLFFSFSKNLSKLERLCSEVVSFICFY
jgi:hypothetical protein